MASWISWLVDASTEPNFRILASVNCRAFLACSAWATSSDAIQWRHLKLSYAGKLGNWELASFELGQIQERLSDAARFYQGIPIEKIEMVEQPLKALSIAIQAKNGAHFTRAFADLTVTCNSCHVAANVGFITIQIPTSSPFSNQLFMPKQK